ncbi:hypothetical protein ACFYNO_11775 [Kitasatospora sp. NPDC006697]|uniref:hypothetical protein n=1 Tax=Kitasatospora sp. NPDC006697 TaxID=3364020 RepID=UPI003682CAF6
MSIRRFTLPVRRFTLPVLATSALITAWGCALPSAYAADAAPQAAPATTARTALAAPGATASGVTVATPAGSGPAAKADAPDLALSSYDAHSGQAVLTAHDTASSKAAAGLHPGQLIDSPPSAGAPHGALVKVTGVQHTPDGARVTTRPATLPELLGHTNASLQAPVAPAAFSIQPQIQGLQVSLNATGITSGNGSISGGLGLTANATVPLPNGSSATLDGSVELNPTIDFSYQGGLGALAPQQARVGFTLGAHADWHVAAGLTATGTPLRIPIATLGASPVVMVGALPVVVNLDLVLTADISADGTVSVDAQQSYDGSWGVHSDYAQGKGWTTSTDPSTSTVTPLKLDLSGDGSIRTGLEAEASVSLYDALGVKASIEPYLRTSLKGSVVLDGTGAAPVVHGTVGLYGGLDINGALFARLAILGTTLAEQDLPFLNFEKEWPIDSWSTPAGTTLPGISTH